MTVTFYDNATPPNFISNSWSFVSEKYNGVTRDVLHQYVGLIQPSGHFSANGGGHTGQPGDYCLDSSTSGGPVHIEDASFLYPAETNNTMTFTFWLAKYDIASSSAFWVNSPSSSGGGRGFQAHCPWSNDNIYYDTAGCCTATTERINASITGFAGYINAAMGDGWWTNWHHFAFVFNQGDKQIWIDGQLFLDGGGGASPLPLDFTDMYIGRDVGDGYNEHGKMDDFACFATPVSAANIALLAAGTLPTALVGENLLAYWDFNEVPVVHPTISITGSGHNVTITYTGTLQSSSTAAGPYTDVAGAPNPYTVNATAAGAKQFYRSRQ